MEDVELPEGSHVQGSAIYLDGERIGSIVVVRSLAREGCYVTGSEWCLEATDVEAGGPGPDRWWHVAGSATTCQIALKADSHQVVAAYPTTGKEIREWDQARTPPGGPSVSPAPDWAQHPDETRLTVCIVDDVLMKGSPDGDNLNRSIIFVTGDGTPQPAITTMPGNLPPNGGPEPDDR